MVKRGISEKQAQALMAELREGQDVGEQLEYADYRIASEPSGTFRNPPGFYVSVIRDNTPVPENFESSRKRRERQELEKQREQGAAGGWSLSRLTSGISASGWRSISAKS